MAVASYALTALTFHFCEYLGLADSSGSRRTLFFPALRASNPTLRVSMRATANRNLQPRTYNRSDDAVVAAVDGDLSAGGCAEGGAAELDDDTGYDPARYLGAENVVSFIGVDR
jgi:hypothetical protein